MVNSKNLLLKGRLRSDTHKLWGDSRTQEIREEESARLGTGPFELI